MSRTMHKRPVDNLVPTEPHDYRYRKRRNDSWTADYKRRKNNQRLNQDLQHDEE